MQDPTHQGVAEGMCGEDREPLDALFLNSGPTLACFHVRARITGAEVFGWEATGMAVSTLQTARDLSIDVLP